MLKQLRAWMLLLGVLFGILVWAKPSQAYPWMIRHEYTGCAVCHTDPSGGFLLTPYGRALTQSLLVTWGKGPEGDEVDSRSGFAWGVPLPEWLNLGASGREMYLYTQPTGQLATSRFIQMQADLRAMVTAGHFEAAGSIGYAADPAGAGALRAVDLSPGWRRDRDRLCRVRRGNHGGRLRAYLRNAARPRDGRRLWRKARANFLPQARSRAALGLRRLSHRRRDLGKCSEPIHPGLARKRDGQDRAARLREDEQWPRLWW